MYILQKILLSFLITNNARKKLLFTVMCEAESRKGILNRTIAN